MNTVKIILFTFLTFGIYCCNTIPKEESQILSYGEEKDWQYFELEKAIEVKIIDHSPSPALCGNLAFASVTIVETKEGERIRILDVCNTSAYRENEIVKVLPAKKPDFNVIFSKKTFGIPKRYQNKSLQIDLKVVKTTYGSLPRK